MILLRLLIIPFLKNIAGRTRSKLENPRIFFVDIDNTICNTNGSDYPSSEPIMENIYFFNRLYEEGNEIHYWTSRGMKSEKDWDRFTIEQLKMWGVEYDSLNMNKPHYDFWIDDKAINSKDI